MRTYLATSAMRYDKVRLTSRHRYLKGARSRSDSVINKVKPLSFTHHSRDCHVFVKLLQSAGFAMFRHAVEMSSHILGFGQTTGDRWLCLRRNGEGRIHVQCRCNVLGYGRETGILSCTRKKRRICVGRGKWNSREHTSSNNGYVSKCTTWFQRLTIGQTSANKTCLSITLHTPWPFLTHRRTWPTRI